MRQYEDDYRYWETLAIGHRTHQVGQIGCAGAWPGSIRHLVAPSWLSLASDRFVYMNSSVCPRLSINHPVLRPATSRWHSQVSRVLVRLGDSASASDVS